MWCLSRDSSIDTTFCGLAGPLREGDSMTEGPCPCLSVLSCGSTARIYLLHAGVPSVYLGLGLPMDPLLGTTSASSPQLPLPLGTSPEVITRTASPSMLISEGIPPISMKWVDLNMSICMEDACLSSGHRWVRQCWILGLVEKSVTSLFQMK